MEEIASHASKCRVAVDSDVVHNSECAYTFHSPFTSDKGLLVNLATFAGTSEEYTTGNGVFVRIVKERVPKETSAPSEDETRDGFVVVDAPSKLGVGVEGGFASEESKWEIITKLSVVSLKNGAVTAEVPFNDDARTSFPDAIVASVESVVNHAGAAVKQDLTAWELDAEPLAESVHAAGLEFVDNGVAVDPDPTTWRCERSGDTENLWLNLSDGYVGGGRRHWDGSGGSNGALDHYVETGRKYPLVVKLGTISADPASADCYSYAEDEDGPVKISNLAVLLEKRGIKVSNMRKTEKSTAELEVELNATYAFDAITEAGADLVPVSGPGLQGLQNLGNSCYVASVVQTLFGGTVPELTKRYSPPDRTVSPTDAPADVLAQTRKLVHGLTSGAFSRPSPASESDGDPRYRTAPRAFKHAVGGDHVDFRTGQQQDAAHYLGHLLETLDRAEKRKDSACPSSKLFSFDTVTRSVCAADRKVRYDSGREFLWSLNVPLPKRTERTTVPDPKRLKPSDDEDEVPAVDLRACLDAWAAPTTVEETRWPHLNDERAPATRTLRFGSFPPFLFLQMQRYYLGDDWVPRKLEVDVDVPEELDLEWLRSDGPADGEDLVPEEKEKDKAGPVVDRAALEQLTAMGFNENGCTRALAAVGGSDVEAATNWIFEHSTDPDFNDPLDATTTNADDGGPPVDEGVVASLTESLGCFAPDRVRRALRECGGDAARAADWLFSHNEEEDAPTTASPSSSSSPEPSLDGKGEYALVGMISHLGKQTGSGHYVCHLKKDGKWVIFNDEKVALSRSPPFKHAYVYLFQRKDRVGKTDPNF